MLLAGRPPVTGKTTERRSRRRRLKLTVAKELLTGTGSKCGRGGGESLGGVFLEQRPAGRRHRLGGSVLQFHTKDKLEITWLLFKFNYFG